MSYQVQGTGSYVADFLENWEVFTQDHGWLPIRLMHTTHTLSHSVIGVEAAGAGNTTITITR